MLRWVAAYFVSFVFGLVVSAVVAHFFGTLGAFIVGVVFAGIGLLLLSSDADAIPLVAAGAYFIGLATVAGWIPLPSGATFFQARPALVVEPNQ